MQISRLLNIFRRNEFGHSFLLFNSNRRVYAQNITLDMFLVSLKNE